MDFALIMFVALVVTGAIWGADRLLMAPARARRVAAVREQGGSPEVVERAAKESVFVEYARAFFPVILAVFLLRSFLVEPFRIPSGSMLPSLLPGDFILVNKFAYGIRLPVINQKIIEINPPARGDVMVFRYPKDPSLNYIKRVIGLPGDHVIYDDKTLYVNGKMMPQSDEQPYLLRELGGGQSMFRQRTEEIDSHQHAILLANEADGGYLTQGLPGQQYDNVIPEGFYFVMGDNRDRSNDSRYWGLVPESHLVGKAFLIWFSWDMAAEESVFLERILWQRIGNAIH